MARETKEFACIADAVAHYAKQGFSTVDYADRSRIMKRGRSEVIINREDFMLVIAEANYGDRNEDHN